MWKIKEIKKSGKTIFKNNVWTLLLLTIFMSVVVGEYLISRDGFTNLEIVESFLEERRENGIYNYSGIEAKKLINKYVDKAVSQLVSGNMTGLIKKYNESHNVTKGVIYDAFNIFTNGQSQLQNLVNSIIDEAETDESKEILVILIAIIALLIKLLIINPILVAENRIYMESINYKKTRITRLAYPFRKKRYINIVLTMLLTKIYLFLWGLTVVGWVIKNYSYRMVKFIIAENPRIKPNDAIKISKEMMKGNKMKTFYLDLSFVGWIILEYLTFGIAGLYVNPYYKAAYAELYKNLRKDYKKNKKYNYEQLNDEILFNRKLLKKKYSDLTEDQLENVQKYPDRYERILKRKIKIDYDKKYEIPSLILFFFIFAFIGWSWEVLLFIFNDGVFVNRGALYGPWLPIYGVGCTLIILLTRFKSFKKMLSNPILTFITIMALCTVIEYFTSLFLELTRGVKYWDYTGIFMNIHGRVCLEGALFFGLGGTLCVYIVAPLLEILIHKMNFKAKVALCIVLVSIFSIDVVYSNIKPHVGTGITDEIREEDNVFKELRIHKKKEE